MLRHEMPGTQDINKKCLITMVYLRSVNPIGRASGLKTQLPVKVTFGFMKEQGNDKLNSTAALH